jgi:lipoprotein NlpD
MKRIFCWLVVILMAGCASGGKHAPVVERGNVVRVVKAPEKSNEKDWRPRVHVVQKGDTLYAIAFNYGLDPRELAEQNNIADPNLIKVGQQINLFAGGAVSRPSVESKPVQSAVKDQPKVVKYPYNETAVTQVEAVQATERPAMVKVEVKPKPEIRAESRPEIKAEVEGEDALEWGMPTQGKVIATFSEADNRKGVDIAGKLGQPIFASAPGKVVYSGSGLRGYGKLLIIKHNKTFLSAYAHNDQLLVKEGETVNRGQKIAEMGSSDSEQVKLHFEVRRLGKPVDPANYLSLNKS